MMLNVSLYSYISKAKLGLASDLKQTHDKQLLKTDNAESQGNTQWLYKNVWKKYPWYFLGFAWLHNDYGLTWDSQLYRQQWSNMCV